MGLQYLHNKLLRIAEKILSRSNFLTELYINLQEGTIREEFSHFREDEVNLLVIGCGSIPNTIISLARWRKWNITGIDRDETAIRNALRIIERYKLRNVRIEKVDGIDVSLKGYDIIVVALGIEPKRKVLERIARDADKGTYILCRTAGLFSRIFGRENFDDIKGLRLVKRYRRKDGTEAIIFLKE